MLETGPEKVIDCSSGKHVDIEPGKVSAIPSNPVEIKDMQKAELEDKARKIKHKLVGLFARHRAKLLLTGGHERGDSREDPLVPPLAPPLRRLRSAGLGTEVTGRDRDMEGRCAGRGRVRGATS